MKGIEKKGEGRRTIRKKNKRKKLKKKKKHQLFQPESKTGGTSEGGRGKQEKTVTYLREQGEKQMCQGPNLKKKEVRGGPGVGIKNDLARTRKSCFEMKRRDGRNGGSGRNEKKKTKRKSRKKKEFD